MCNYKYTDLSFAISMSAKAKNSILMNTSQTASSPILTTLLIGVCLN
jgi:hypothetical protein